MSQAEQPPPLIDKVLQPCDDLCVPPLDLLQPVHVSVMLGSSELDALLQVSSHQSRGAELPLWTYRPCMSHEAAQDMFGFLGCKCTLLGHVHPLIQVLFSRAAFNPFSAQPAFVLGIALPQGHSSLLCNSTPGSSK